MKHKTSLQANFKRHKGAMIAILIIIFVVSLSFLSVMTIWMNSNSYVVAEMDRMNYGDMTVWTEEIPNETAVYTEIEQLSDVDTVAAQQLIYTDYEISDQYSDSEGQLLVYEPERFPYHIFQTETMEYTTEDVNISQGEIYMSPSLLSTFDCNIGDSIRFPIGREGNQKTFVIKGTFEDPYMGSSMIGMKSFLISEEDYEEISEMIEVSGINALARVGQMIHIKQSPESTLNHAQFNQLLNEQTTLGDYIQFAHSKDAISSYMLILQNAFAGLSLSFVLILLLVSLIIISYSITGTIEQDQRNMGILKTIGYSGTVLRSLLTWQYLMVLITGCVLGMLLSLVAVPFISSRMVSFAGIVTPSTPRILLWLFLLITVTVLFSLFLHIKTKRIHSIPPIRILQGETEEGKQGHNIPLQQRYLLFRLSLRQLWNGKRRYISVCLTAVLLVFITSMIGRMNSWLGPDGKGMMDAFNSADLDVGIQLIGNQDIEEMEQQILQYSSIIDSYELAMPSVSLNGVDVTANVISEPERFHIQQGTTSQEANEIVITETMAADRKVDIDDRVTLSYNGKSATYTITGIYQCANDMGNNIGMSRAGFLVIGNDTPAMWCHHYFLESPEHKQEIMDTLQASYGGDVYIHENSWPGLFSIITAMQTLLLVMYGLSAIFILIVTIMTGHKIFLSEKRNLSIYKALGFTTAQLRLTFALRYGVSAGFGSLAGIIISMLFTDTIVGTLMNQFGISNFISHPDLATIVLPGIMVTLLFAGFAYLTSGKIANLDMNELIAE